MKAVFLILVLWAVNQFATAQITEFLVLNHAEKEKLQQHIQQNNQISALYEVFAFEANKGLQKKPNPLEIIYYEGLLNNNPKRIKTVKSFADIDYTVNLIYASYGTKNEAFGKKAKEIILAWAKTYKPTGNPINENKFSAFFWGYYLFNQQFSDQEKKIVESWMYQIANLEKNRTNTPNNNWEAKRCKIIGIIGCILNNDSLKDYSLEHFKKYITTAYYPDGTSFDLKQRDALSYHISGLKPCISAFINCSKFDSRFNLFASESETGSSVKKSVEYVLPFATGEKKRQEWTNTKVKLDKERAAAGLAEYQPGMYFNPEKAHELFELASYYNPEWVSVFEKENRTTSWIGFLNGHVLN